jgi:RimJ/RimL family protein N-acetyltransferase
MTHYFYTMCCDDPVISPSHLDSQYKSIFWRPSWTSVKPSGISGSRFIVWWLFHCLRVFANRDYGLFLVYCDKALIHRSCVFPRFFRFPFMKKKDLQIGDTWTSEQHRRRGIAKFAIEKILEECRLPGRRFWYIVEEENVPSIKAVEKVGFTRAGTGDRVNRFGLRILGKYEILSPSSD